MKPKQILPRGVRTVMTGLAMGESPRWHEDRLWFSDWGAQKIIAAHADGTSEIAVRVPFALPFCIDCFRDVHIRRT
jgi:sugar lactone lactonase YvrE